MDWLITLWLLGAWLPIAFVTMGCCQTECADCNSGTTPSQVQVDISGMVDKDCTDCDLLDGLYTLDRTSGSGSCNWSANTAYCTSNIARLRFHVGEFIPVMDVRFEDSTGSAYYYWQESFAPPVDCSAWMSQPIDDTVSKVGFGGIGAPDPCTHTGATVTVSSL